MIQLPSNDPLLLNGALPGCKSEGPLNLTSFPLVLVSCFQLVPATEIEIIKIVTPLFNFSGYILIVQ